MAHGGKREGSGRKAGSKYLDLRAMLEEKGKKDGQDYIEEFLAFLLANYMEDTRLMIWAGEHIFGKPQQNVDVTSGGEPLSITFDTSFDGNTTRETKGGSKK